MSKPSTVRAAQAETKKPRVTVHVEQVAAVAAEALASVGTPPAKKSRPTPLDLFFATITEQPYRDSFAALALTMMDMGISNSDAADILRTLAGTITKTAEKSAMRTKNSAAQETPK